MNEDLGNCEMQVKSVFHSVDTILRILNDKRVSSLSGVTELLDTFNAIFPEGVNNSFSTKRIELFVVFEGLDGSGKSTIARGVAKALNGFRASTPPRTVSHLRTLFDQYSPNIRRAYYSLGNYIAAKRIDEICQERTVLLDRFWHSTAAYALAQELDGKDVDALPPAGDPIYKWPEDLLKPDLVLFLDVCEETRNIRHAKRQKTTEEEDQLVKNEAFRNLVVAAYDRMDGIPVIHVNSNCSVKETVTECLEQINDFSKNRKSHNS